MKKARELHQKWLKDREYRREHSALAMEFELADTLIAARTNAGLTQAEVARRMKTSQSFVARLEGGTIAATWKSLHRYAAATGAELKIELKRPSR